MFRWLNYFKCQRVIANWKGSLFLIGGKVLIKALARAIPTYAMSCLKLPKGCVMILINSLARFFFFFRVSSLGYKKVHWLNWKIMCTPKKVGGMSFRNLENFNQALLAKQAWRILQNRLSLVAREFKGSYFHFTNFLSPGGSYNPFYVWRSVLQGRSLLLRGIRRQIGRGEETLVFLPTLDSK